jgi:hypothetical protein
VCRDGGYVVVTGGEEETKCSDEVDSAVEEETTLVVGYFPPCKDSVGQLFSFPPSTCQCQKVSKLVDLHSVLKNLSSSLMRVDISS